MRKGKKDAKVIFASGRSQPRVFYNNLFYAKIRWRKSALETNAKKLSILQMRSEKRLDMFNGSLSEFRRIGRIIAKSV